MRIEYTGLSEIKGSLVALDGVKDARYDELIELTLEDGTRRRGRVILIEGERVVAEVFEGTSGIDMAGTSTRLTGKPMEIPLSEEILGRIFDGTGRPADGLSEVYAEEMRDINGAAINPVSREYPRSCILTGVSAIDATCTLIRGQKLPIFSGAGMKHNELAAQIVRQAHVASDAEGEKFVIVFCAMGIKNDTADFFRRDFTESGALDRTVMYINLASDPIIERILAPRCALTAAEYLAFTKGYHVLVVMTDMTFYCEALREFSSSKGEIPSRKGFPSYMYSDLASLYERAGLIRGKSGSVTLVPILTMPGDDISHPIPDLTGYITEGQIVLSRELSQKGIYPPVGILPSLSRLMKDGTGKGFTRADHPDLSNQLFASYSEVSSARSLATVIGEDELSQADKLSLKFGSEFENRFVNQGMYENRSLETTLDLGWELLSILPRSALSRVSDKVLDEHYHGKG
ncbi:MAG TPA: V-type ATP synthase subunit B [Candidatus Scatomorpha intestinavium]|uniref:V-type ATP synthase beta chain n=1 Tax=Candidatus Scatomorpha intestinavium TaxID=2840922 RepID=A0A9D1CUF7_9FIRM|nr:V-type ATP synthase subunit B [Candidatus Scatomorpha intestinavium]